MVRLQKALLEDEVLARKLSDHDMGDLNISVVVAVVHPTPQNRVSLCRPGSPQTPSAPPP